MSTDHLERAEKIIASGDVSQFGYAVLELRLAIEEHVYRKLAHFTKRHGEKLLYEKWQPNKAIKILCQLEPHADRSYTLSMALEKEPGKQGEDFVLLGQHEALSASWITKHYNKLGSYLHLQPDSRSQKQVPLEYVEEVIAELRRISNSNLITSIAETVHFECPLCQNQVVCCIESLPGLEEVICPGMNCNATFLPKQNEEGWGFKLNAVDFECPECGRVRPVLHSELSIGARIRCQGCEERFIVKENTWHIAKVIR